MYYLRAIFLLMPLAIMFLACDSGRFTRAGQNEEHIYGALDGQTIEGQLPVKVNFITKYNFQVELKSLKFKLCEGEAELQSFSDMTHRLVGQIPCRGDNDMDLGILVAEDIFLAQDAIAKQLPLYGLFNRVTAIGNVSFEPPLVEAISPTISDSQAYSNLLSEESVVFIKNSESGAGTRESGKMRTEVVSVGPFQPEGYDEMFNEVIHWRRSFEDFNENINFGHYKVYREIEYWVQPRPFVITRMRMHGKLRELMPEPKPGEKADFTSRLGLNVMVTFELKHHETH